MVNNMKKENIEFFSRLYGYADYNSDGKIRYLNSNDLGREKDEIVLTGSEKDLLKNCTEKNFEFNLNGIKAIVLQYEKRYFLISNYCFKEIENKLESVPLNSSFLIFAVNSKKLFLTVNITSDIVNQYIEPFYHKMANQEFSGFCFNDLIQLKIFENIYIYRIDIGEENVAFSAECVIGEALCCDKSSWANANILEKYRNLFILNDANLNYETLLQSINSQDIDFTFLQLYRLIEYKFNRKVYEDIVKKLKKEFPVIKEDEQAIADKLEVIIEFKSNELDRLKDLLNHGSVNLIAEKIPKAFNKEGSAYKLIYELRNQIVHSRKRRENVEKLITKENLFMLIEIILDIIYELHKSSVEN